MKGEKLVLYDVTTALRIDVSYLKDYTPSSFLENFHLPGVLLRFSQVLSCFQGHLLDFERQNSQNNLLSCEIMRSRYTIYSH